MNEIPTPPRPRRWLRWLKRLGWCTLWLVTLVALLVAFENWRGRRAWKRFVAESKAAGEDLSHAAIVPPPVPDEENLAMSPLFKPLLDYTRGTKPGESTRWNDTNGLNRLEQMKPIPDSTNSPRMAGWRRGEFVDMGAWQAAYRANSNYPSTPTPQAPGEDVLFALGKYDSELADLRIAAARPKSRFPLHYEDNAEMFIRHVSQMRKLTQFGQLRALAELSLKQNGLAHEDVLLALRWAESIADEPILISQLVRIVSLEITMQPLWEGLVRHEWSDAQLAAFETRLAKINLVLSYGRAMRGERCLTLNGIDTLRRNPIELQQISDGGGPHLGFIPFMTSGVFDHNKVVMGRMYAQLIESVELDARRFKPESALAVEQQLIALKPNWWRHPYSILATLLMPAITKAMERTASMQATVDLARIAIALERHRLKHGALPETLDALDAAVEPAGGVPRDVITGEPLRYQRQADGKFKLYSIGWDHVDDSGVPAFFEENRARIDFTKGDWVWPMPEK